MELNLVVFSIVQFALVGVYFICWLVLGHSHFFYREREAGPYLVLAISNFASLIILYFVVHAAFEDAVSTQLFPFMSTLWLLSIYVYMREMISMFKIESSFWSGYLKFLKIAIFVMGLITFFFRLEGFRRLFFAPTVSYHSEHFLATALNSEPTTAGTICIIALSALVIAGHAFLFQNVLKSKRELGSNFFLFSALIGLPLSIYDLATLLGAINFAPLTSFVYVPLLAHFMSSVFSAPYFRAHALGEKLKQGLRGAGMRRPSLKRVISETDIKTMGKDILEILQTKYKGRVSFEMELEKGFKIDWEKTELAVVLYNLAEKAFSCASLREESGAKVKMIFQNDGKNSILLVNNGPSWRFRKDLSNKSFFHIEEALLKKLGCKLSASEKEGLANYVVEFSNEPVI